MPTPRQFQSSAIARVGQKLREGVRAVLLTSPVGSGKTVMLGFMAAGFVHAPKPRRVAWLAHRRELVLQAARTLGPGTSTRPGFGLEIGYNGLSPSAPVQITTVQGALRDATPIPADVLMLDEARHYVADEWAELPKRYPNAIIIGADATPERGDGRPLGSLFQTMVVAAQIRELQELGFLVPLDIRHPKAPLRPDQIAQHPVDAYAENCRGQKAIVFSQTVKQAEEHCRQFIIGGWKASCVFGTTDTAERDATFARFSDGDLDVLVNVDVATEGYDAPAASCCITARGAGTFGRMVQMVGRVLRAYCTCGRGARGEPCSCAKPGATWLDLRGISHPHLLGRPDADAEYSLDGEAGMWRKGAAPGERLCPICSSALGEARVCPTCGKDLSQEKPLRVTGEKLVYWKEEIRKDPPSVRVKRLAKWLRDAWDKGHKTDAAKFKFKGVYGYFPSPVDVSYALQLADVPRESLTQKSRECMKGRGRCLHPECVVPSGDDVRVRSDEEIELAERLAIEEAS